MREREREKKKKERESERKRETVEENLTLLTNDTSKKHRPSKFMKQSLITTHDKYTTDNQVGGRGREE